MTKRRIFIAINLPANLKRQLLKLQEKWADLPMRWTSEHNMHLTLVFIGWVTDDGLSEICRITREIAKRHEPFEIKFERVIYGPPDGPKRMIWAEGGRSEALEGLKADLEDALLESGRSGLTEKETRLFRPHLTLGRFKMDAWRHFSPKPEIDLEFEYAFNVETVEVMESHLARSGAEYAALESAPLKNE